SLHWLSTCRDAFLFEDCVEDSPLRHELTHQRVQAVDGWITVPEGPGLGVTLNEDFIAAHLIAESGRLSQADGHANGSISTRRTISAPAFPQASNLNGE